MESLAEFAFELLSSPAGLAMVVAVATVTVVLSSGLAAFVVELSEGIGTARHSPVHDDQTAGRRCPERSAQLEPLSAA